LIPIDEVTFQETLKPFCIKCGYAEIEPDDSQPPFWGSNHLVVIPLVCKKCQYAFSINILIEPTSMMKGE